MQYSWVYYRCNIFFSNINWKRQYSPLCNSNFASPLRSIMIKWAEVEGSFQSLCKTPLTYRWLIWFKSMLSSAFPSTHVTRSCPTLGRKYEHRLGDSDNELSVAIHTLPGSQRSLCLNSPSSYLKIFPFVKCELYGSYPWIVYSS